MNIKTVFLVIVILILLLNTFQFKILEYVLIISCLVIYKLITQSSTSIKPTHSVIGGLSLETLIKKISKNYPYYDNFKKLFLINNKKINNVMVTVDDINHRLKYDISNPISRGDHIGQRKLLLTEVQFLTNVITEYNYDIKYCLYAGSAPGHKTHFLSNLFPDIKFILVDPNKFNLFLVDEQKYHRNTKHKDIVHLYNEYPSNVNTYMNKKINDMNKKDEDDVINFIKTSDYKIFIIEDFMDEKYAKLLSQLGDQTFISDIRSNTSEDNSHPLDMDIYWNTSMMYNWMNIIKPKLSMLKIRMPFFNKKVNMSMYEAEFKISKQYGIDFIDDYKNFKLKMCKSKLYLQAWSRNLSTELRMYITEKDINNIIEYDIKEIEEKMFYFNCIDRGWNLHVNDNANRHIGFCHCNDCALENKIWENYIKINNTYIKTVNEYIDITNKITSRNLNKVHTGQVWTKLSNSLYELNKIADICINKKIIKTNFGSQKGMAGKN